MSTNTFPWKTLEVNDTEWMQRTFCIYGPSGSGKTTLAAQFPQPLLLSFDPGVMGGSMSAVGFGVKQLKVATYKDLIDLLPVLKVHAGVEFKTLIIDSLTYCGKMVMNNILATVGREIPRFEEWGLNYKRVAKLIENFTDMNCHVVFTAIDNTQKDEVSGKISGGPSLPGQLQKELPQAVDCCLRLFTQTGYNAQGKLEVTYKYRTVPDDTWNAKDRTRLLPSEEAWKLNNIGTLTKLFTHEDA